MAKRKAAHHKGSYQADARRCRDRANANPTQRCMSPTCKHKRHINGQWVGGLLQDHKPGARWQAGHRTDGQIGGPLQPEADECNTAAGATLGNQRRQGLTTTQQWFQ